MTRQSAENTEHFDESSGGQEFFERVAQWLDCNDLKHSAYPGKQFFSLRHIGDNEDRRVFVNVGLRDNGRRLLIYSIYGVSVPEGTPHHTLGCMLLARLNCYAKRKIKLLAILNFDLLFKHRSISIVKQSSLSV